ncbi:MAG: hypothetical protein Q9222_003452 [Ikaeria aurantiellina]
MARSKPLYNLLTGELITVIVGEKRKEYRIHHDLICYRSDYFRAAFMWEYQEASSGELKFLQEEESTFDLFVVWLYGADFTTPKALSKLKPYISLLEFARTILLEELCDDIIHLIRRYYYLKSSRPIDRTVHVDLPVTSEDLSYFYDHPVGFRLRVCLCLQAALQAYQPNVTPPINPYLADLLEQGGELASHYPKLVLYVGQRLRDHDVSLDFAAGEIFRAFYDCLFHEHGRLELCTGYTPKSGIMFIIGAFRCVGEERASEGDKRRINWLGRQRFGLGFLQQDRWGPRNPSVL